MIGGIRRSWALPRGHQAPSRPMPVGAACATPHGRRAISSSISSAPVHANPFIPTQASRHGARTAIHAALLQREVPESATTATLAPRQAPPGDVVSINGCVALTVSQPAYAVNIAYCSKGRPLEECDGVWAHVGHSGWSNTMDIELTRSKTEPHIWEGVYA